MPIAKRLAMHLQRLSEQQLTLQHYKLRYKLRHELSL